MGETRNIYNISVGNPKGKRPLDRHKQNGRIIIRIDLKVAEYEGMGCNHLAQNKGQWRALENTVTDLRVA
jgi:hypothetical protein